ncbi:MAG: EAL domain-containing protein [Gammaproteobacteria bacterium]
MKRSRFASRSWREWAAAAFVSALMLSGGARLILLNTQREIAENRDAAAHVAERTASSLEAQLETLVERAQQEAARATEVLARSPQTPESIAPDNEGFWIANDGSILPAAHPTDDPAAQEALAREWRAREPNSKDAAGIEWLAPLRHGSQWLVAVRAPILISNGTAAEYAGWAVVYQPLEEMLLRSGIGELPQEGYELALGQQAPGREVFRLLTGSPFVASQDHVAGMIRLPDALRGKGASEPYMVLALRPSAGWYSPARLTAHIGLLLLLTWLLCVGAYDLTQGPKRWAAPLAVARKRLVATSRRLAEELEGRRRLQLRFQHARFHDSFTGLPNRRYFMNRLDRALRDRGGRGQLVAVILVDIDRFRLVNDTLGQTAGDELMMQVARRFENKIGEDVGHVLARWSGDQFALLLLHVHSSETAVTFAKLLTDALVGPFVLRRHTFSVAAHVGITCVDTELQRTDDVVREAAVALSVAKQREAADPVVYEAALSDDVVSSVGLEADLHVALERQQFQLLFQPIVDLADGRVVGAEALLRWRHPVEGLLAPDRFLQIAEDARLIVPISRWVIRNACKRGGEWRRVVDPATGFYVSINLAATALYDPQLVRYVADVLQKTGLPAKSLRFEITEADLTPHVGAAREVLDALHDMGIGLVLDHFGTGYSSLSYLELFPIDCVKIDRPFVNAADGSDSAVMRSVLYMTASLGLEAIAEKVETEAAVQALKRMGCKYGQGYLLGEPLDAEQLFARLAVRVPMPAALDPPTPVLPRRPEPRAQDPAVADTATRGAPERAAPQAPTVEHDEAPAEALDDSPTQAFAIPTSASTVLFKSRIRNR